MIVFGTGGIRGRMGEEFDEKVIVKASRALGNYMKEIGENRVVIAYDTRLNSKEYAILCARTLSGMGIETHIFKRETPTPVLSFACRYMEAFGVVITASHNPKEYNGYKVYTPDGIQALPEVTSKLSKLFEMESSDPLDGKFEIVPDEVEEKYIESLMSTVEPPSRRLKVAYTPLHGTGWRFVPKILKDLGFEVIEVKEQMKPDGNFPTVETPNPEEDSALSVLKGYMENADIGLANDPDADRLGVLVKKGGKIVKLTGNQVGVLTTDFLTFRNLPENPVVVKTIVTTNMVKVMGKDRGFEVEETPTGFKFIGELVEKHHREGDKTFVFGFEESYGYLKGYHVRDKDGVQASALVSWVFSSIDPIDRLEELYKDYGYHLEKLFNVETDDVEESRKIYETMKKSPEKFFEGLRDFLDYSKGVEGVRRNETLKVSLDLGDIFIRPSGTEPKLKFYLMVVSDDEKDSRRRLEALEGVVKDVVSRARGEG